MPTLSKISFKKDCIIKENFWSVKLDLTKDLDESPWETMVHVIFLKNPNNPKQVAVYYMLCGAIDNEKQLFEKFSNNFIGQRIYELNDSQTPESFTNTNISNDKFFDKNEKLIDTVATRNKLQLVYEMNRAIALCKEKNNLK